MSLLSSEAITRYLLIWAPPSMYEVRGSQRRSGFRRLGLERGASKSTQVVRQRDNLPIGSRTWFEPPLLAGLTCYENDNIVQQLAFHFWLDGLNIGAGHTTVRAHQATHAHAETGCVRPRTHGAGYQSTHGGN